MPTGAQEKAVRYGMEWGVFYQEDLLRIRQTCRPTAVSIYCFFLMNMDVKTSIVKKLKIAAIARHLNFNRQTVRDAIKDLALAGMYDPETRELPKVRERIAEKKRVEATTASDSPPSKPDGKTRGKPPPSAPRRSERRKVQQQKEATYPREKSSGSTLAEVMKGLGYSNGRVD